MRDELQHWLGESRVLTAAIYFHLALLLFAIIALPFDHRSILGLNPWVKPMKFDLSSIIFLTAIAAILSGLEGWKRSRAVIAAGIGIALIVENSIISLQSLRGVRSHMNYTTVHDALLFSVMGLFIALNTALLACALALWCFVRSRWPSIVGWGVRLGLLAILAGSLEGAYMVVHGAHTVGAPDGFAGIPFLNWSSAHGDLRIPHFFALHALQIMPVAALALTRTRWRPAAQLTTLLAFFGAYMTLVALLFRQALAGQPLIG